MNALRYFAAFTLGAAVASIVTYKLVDAKYEKIIQEEIESVKDSLSKNSRVDISEKEDENTEFTHSEPEEKEEYEQMIDEKYDTMSKQTDIPRENPYEIMEEDYGELYDYNTVSLTYYKDDILADEMDNPVDDDIKNSLMDIIKNTDQFDTLYIRSDARECDYEIYFDKDKWSDTYDPAMEE